MSKYLLEKVITDDQKKEFLNLPKTIYKGNRNWVCPLDRDIEKIFDPACNELMQKGEAIRWIARDDDGKVVGRIAAFYNKDQALREEQLTGGCGFFESVNNRAVADLLFDAAKEWLKSKGMEAMDGPINFGDRAEWWGLLVDGFEFQPLYANPYNPPYYKDLFEDYGFKNYFNQHTYNKIFKSGTFNPSVYERVKRLEDQGGFRFDHIKKRDLKKVAEDFRVIYNKAWAKFSGVKPMDKEHSQKLMQTLKPIIDPRLIYFAHFNDEPVGFFIMVPDLNRIIGRFNGKLNWINKIRLMLMLKCTNKADRIFAIIFAVIPELHGKGIESGIVHAFEQQVIKGKVPYQSLELAWIGDFNPVMMRMVENYVMARKHKMHTTYRYLFDREQEFHRAPRMGIVRNS